MSRRRRLDDEQLELPGVPKKKPDYKAVVMKWASDHLHNSPLSRSTEAWNHLQSKFGELVKKLEEI